MEEALHQHRVDKANKELNQEVADLEDHLLEMEQILGEQPMLRKLLRELKENPGKIAAMKRSDILAYE